MAPAGRGVTVTPMEEQRLDAPRMLAELDFPAGEGDRRAILHAFGETLDPFQLLLESIELRRDAHTQQKFGIVHLMSRSVSDLLAGGHLAAHCYLPQAYCVLRPVLDSCDLIELFAQDAEQATLWTTTTQGHIDFAPSSVRKRIGRDKLDPVHSHFRDSGTHPRFAGAQLSGGMQIAPDDPSDRTALFRIGPTWPEAAATLIVWPFTFQLALQLAATGLHLVPLAVDPTSTEVTWLCAYLASLDAASQGTTIVLDLLGESDDSPFRTAWAPGREALEQRLAELTG
jgi:hypothetical protein